jgi:hypothetical protein
MANCGMCVTGPKVATGLVVRSCKMESTEDSVTPFLSASRVLNTRTAALLADKLSLREDIHRPSSDLNGW